MTASIPRANGIVRFTCDKAPHLASTCSITVADMMIAPSAVQIDGTSLALTADLTELAVGGEYPVVFDGCAVTAQATITIANGTRMSSLSPTELPIPAVMSVEPSFHIFAGETYTYKIAFNQPVHLVQEEAIEVASADETVLVSAVAVDATTIQFSYNASTQGSLQFTLKKEAVKDDLQRELPEDVAFTRMVGLACGPAHLASLSADAGVCQCRRTNDQCECHCGSMGAAMNY